MVETDTKSSHATTNLTLQAEISSYLATIRSFANCCRVIALLNKTQRHPTELETDAMNDFSYDLVVPAHIRAANESHIRARNYGASWCAPARARMPH